MQTLTTPAGTVQIHTLETAFAALAGKINAVGKTPGGTVALSGGSTPMAFYRWAAAQKVLAEETLQNVDWLVSDERCVPLASDDSNFGNAARELLDPLGVAAERRHPWPVELAPAAAAKAFAEEIRQRKTDGGNVFDLCVLGLGDDAHTASLWPECPLIGDGGKNWFAATEWPGRGWRLTITEAGMAACGEIVVLAFGEKKAAALQAVAHGAAAQRKFPGQVLRAWPEKVTWLVDEAAAILQKA